MVTPEVAFHVGLNLLVGGLLLTLAGFVYRTARDRVHNVVFSALFALSGLRSVADAVAPLASEFHARTPFFPGPVFWFHAVYTLAFLMVPLLLVFVSLFPRPLNRLIVRPGLGIVYFVPSIVIAALWFLPPIPGFTFTRVQLLLFFNGYSLVAVVGAVLWLAVNLRRTRDPIERTRLQYLVGVFAVYALGSLVIAFPLYNAYYGLSLPALPQTAALLLAPFMEIAAAAVIGYAILKYQLLGVELKVKKGVRYAATTSTLFIVLFVTTNSLEELVIEQFFGFTQAGYLLASAVGTLLFKPIERLTGVVTNKLFPDTTKDPTAYLRGRAQDIYHAQVSYILRDAQVSDRERGFLAQLAGQLGLNAKDVAAVEGRVRGLVGLAAPPTSPADAATSRL